MQASEFWRLVTMDRSDSLGRLVRLFQVEGIRCAVIGGQAVNAYAEPLVSLHLDLALAAADLERADAFLRRHFHVERFPHSLNVSAAGSELRVQIQTDPRYADFIREASERDVLGMRMPVADVQDVHRGKVWAAQDPDRRASRRLKDLADIARLLEKHPELRDEIPADVLARLR
jgi:hypothetical protein